MCVAYLLCNIEEVSISLISSRFGDFYCFVPFFLFDELEGAG